MGYYINWKHNLISAQGNNLSCKIDEGHEKISITVPVAQPTAAASLHFNIECAYKLHLYIQMRI